MIYQNKNILKAHMQVKSLADELQISKETLQIQNSKLEYDVYHDSLTGMKNRLSSGTISTKLIFRQIKTTSLSR
jgi:hypothetical protein